MENVYFPYRPNCVPANLKIVVFKFKQSLLLTLLCFLVTGGVLPTYGAGVNPHIRGAALTAQTITFSSIAAKTYGEADFAPGAKASSGLAVTYTSSNVAIASVVNGKVHILKAGSVTITASQAGNGVYSAATPVSKSLVINKAALVITAGDRSKKYGAALPAFGVSYSGFVNGDTAVTTKPKIEAQATIASPVGTYTITASGAVAANYSITYILGKLTITPAPLVITAVNKTKPHGLANPPLTVSYKGFVNGDTSVTVKPAVTTTATTTSLPGSYPITASGASSGNYSITYVGGTLQVTAVPFAFAATATTIYGTPDFLPGAVSGYTITYTSSSTSVATIVNGKIHIVKAGSVTITAKSNSQTLTQVLAISKAPLTIIVSDKSKVYGAALPAFTVTYKGFVNGDSTVTTAPQIVTTAKVSSPVSTYAITASGAVAANYSISYTAGKLTVSPAPLTITADKKSKLYGATLPALTYKYSGLVNGDTAVAVLPVLATTANAKSAVADYDITIGSASSPNYTIKFVKGILSVTPAPLNIAVANATMVKGATIPQFTIKYTGFASGETEANLTTKPVVAYKFDSNSPAGTYALNIGGAASKNYNITYTSGVMTITEPVIVKNAPVLSYPASKTFTVGVTSANTVPVNTGGAVPAVFKQLKTFAGSGVSGSANGVGTAASFNFYNQNVLAADKLGNIYVADQGNYRIRKISADGVVTNFVGSGVKGSADGTGEAASFGFIYGMVVDKDGALFVSDLENFKIRKVTAAGKVTTFAGSGRSEIKDGTGINASFVSPTGLATDKLGNIYTVDAAAQKLKKITPLGVVTTLKTDTTLQYDEAIAIDTAGNFYVTGFDQRVKKITPAGIITVIAGSGARGYADGTGAAAIFNSPGGITMGPDGNIYIADAGNNFIRRVTPQGVVTTFAGTGVAGNINGPLDVATIAIPSDVTFDKAGNMFIAASGSRTICRINYEGYSISPSLPKGLNFNSSTGVISGTTLASSPTLNYTIIASNAYGSGSASIKLTVKGETAPLISYPTPNVLKEGVAASIPVTNTGGSFLPGKLGAQVVSVFAGSGAKGSTNGVGTAANFNYSDYGAVAVDRFGNVFVADRDNNVIRKITPLGVVSTFAGSGKPSYGDGQGVAASFNQPQGIAVDRNGTVYVADTYNNRIRRITTAGLVTTLAGTGITGANNGPAAGATFNRPAALTIDNFNTLYVAEPANSTIRQINLSNGVVNSRISNPSIASVTGIVADPYQTIFTVGNDHVVLRYPTQGAPAVVAGANAGFADGINGAARFNRPAAITIDGYGRLYIADAANNRIRMITNSEVTTIAGTGNAASSTGAAIASSFSYPTALAVTPAGVVYVLDRSLSVRKIAEAGISIVPSLPGGLIFDDATGTIRGTSTAVSGPVNYTITASNSGGTSVTTVNLSVLNSVENAAKIYTIAGTGARSHSGDGGSAAAARIVAPYAMALDKAGNIYMATSDHRIRKIDAVTKLITTIAGNGTPGYSGDGGPAASAQVNIGLTGLALDAQGNLYMSDYYNQRIRRIDAVTKIITTIAGNGQQGYSGDGGPAVAASLRYPTGIAIDAANNVYFSDGDNYVIRKIDAATKVISTVAGGGVVANDGLPATSHRLSYVERFTFDKKGNMLIVDEGAFTVLKVDAATKAVTRIAGMTYNTVYEGDGVKATQATFAGPLGIALDSAENIYITDQPKHVIRRIDAKTNVITTYAGVGVPAYAGDGASASAANINFITDIAFDKSGFLLIDDYVNNVIRRVGGGPQPQTITFAKMANKMYGNADFVPDAFATSGQPLTFTSSDTTILKPVNGQLHIVASGQVTITAYQNGNANFTAAAKVSQPLIISPATVSVFAEDKVKVFKSVNPPLTLRYFGFVNGDTVNVITIQPVLTTTATTNSPVGNYPITVSGGKARSYLFNYVPGTLVIKASGTTNAVNSGSLAFTNSATGFTAGQMDEPQVSAALSPNGDGFNDVLVIENIANYPENRLILANRNGDKVYEASGYDNSSKVFDGRSGINGKRQQPGTYFYTLEYKADGQVKRKTGYFLIK